MKKNNEEMKKKDEEIRKVAILENELQKLKSENIKYAQKIDKQQNINTQNNIDKQQNIQINNNIKLLAFGKEDITHLADEVCKKIEFVNTNERSFI